MDLQTVFLLIQAVIFLGGMIFGFLVLSTRIQSNISHLLQLECKLDELQTKVPSEKLIEIEGFITILRKEFETLLEAQDDFRDACKRETNRQRALLDRRHGPRVQGARSDLKKEPEAPDDDGLPDRISPEEAAAMATNGGNAVAGAANSREEVRRTIRDAYFKARRV